MYFLSFNLQSSQAHVSVFPNTTFCSSHCSYFELCIWRRMLVWFWCYFSKSKLVIMTEDFLVKNIGNGITIKHDRLTVLHNFLNENLGLFFFFFNWSDLCLFRWWYRELEKTAISYEVSSNVYCLQLSGITSDKFIF